MKTKPSSQINFGTGIKITTQQKIKAVSKQLANCECFFSERSFSDSIIQKPSAFSLGICDCIAGGVWDGKKVTLFHILPSQKNVDCLAQILKEFSEKLDLSGKNLRGLIIGGASHQRSRMIFDGFEAFMKEQNIPCSILREHKNKYANSSILFNSKKDEWLVSNFRINQHLGFLKTLHKKISQEQLVVLLNANFNKVEISPLDKLYA